MAKQVQKLKQVMKLSPQQMMLMKMLQMPSTVLEQAIYEELDRNPLLEADRQMEDASVNTEQISGESPRNDVEDFFSEDDDYGYRTAASDPSGGEMVIASDASTVDSLMEQLSMKDISEREAAIVAELIGSLDDAGYLSRDIELIENELAFRQNIECRDGEMDHALKVLQSLDPAGVGARDLRECLLLQLARIHPQTFESRCAAAVVDQCFEQLGQHNYAAIMDRLEIDEDALEGAIDCIQHLNPKPCGSDSGSTQAAPTIVPDFIVAVSDGHLKCTLNNSRIPSLKINTSYIQMLNDMEMKSGSRTAADRQTIDFLKEKAEAAQDFITNLDQRQQNLRNTISLVAKKQRKFFVTGDPADLKPLSQKEVADAVGVDESVMSRIVNQKYVQTDFGTMLLKEFFVHATTNNDEGEDVTGAAISKHLQEFVDGEDKQNPLSDAQIVELFAQQGIPLARRTVAKYRDKLGIPVAKLRRALKIIILILALSAGQLFAQPAQSYFDSLIMAQQQLSPKGKPAAQQQVTKVRKAVKIDTALLRGDDLNRHEIDPLAPLPSMMWYGSKFSSSRVRLENYSMDSLPDEVNLRLIKGDEQFCFPVKNVRTSPYGWRWERPHRGVDIALNTGDPVRCAFDGMVRVATVMGGYGNVVVVRHYNGLETVYGHLSRIHVKPHQQVKAGDVLGLGGSTGHSTGPHLHFEVRFQYEPFDPEWIIDFDTYSLRTKKLHLDKTYFGISKPRNRHAQVFKADKSFVREEPIHNKPKELYYTVKKGDKMAAIATQYKTTVEKIVELNPDFERLRPGLKLRVR